MKNVYSPSMESYWETFYTALLSVLPAASALIIIGIVACVTGVIVFVVMFLTFVFDWKIFTKAGRRGWKAIVPFYNLWTMLSFTTNDATKKFCFIPACIAGGFYFLALPAMLIPGVSVFMAFFFFPICIVLNILLVVGYAFLNFSLAKSFGMKTGLCVFSLFFPFINRIMLAFGKFEYTGNRFPIIGKNTY